jgi:L-serine dehydratase
MTKSRTGIFNNVLGPVMRGPSSSHTAASLSLGTIARQLLGEQPVMAEFQFDPNGSLATTYLSQGSAMGLAGGMLGLSITDPSLTEWENLSQKAGLIISYKIEDIGASHPNTYTATITGKDGSKISFTAISTGGGAIKFIEINGSSVDFDGSGYDVISRFKNLSGRDFLLNSLTTTDDNTILIRETGDHIHIHSSTDLADHSTIFRLKASKDLFWVLSTDPVMPVIMKENPVMPFDNIFEFTELIKKKGVKLSDYAVNYETSAGNISEHEVLNMSEEYMGIIKNSVKQGLGGTKFSDRILHTQSTFIAEAEKKGKLIPDPLMNEIIASVSAIMETKSSLGLIVAAPTAGSCGTVGGVLIPAAKLMKKDSQTLSRALLAAGLFGVFIADITGFAAEEGGCQYECGAASGMAAAGLAELAGADALTALNAGGMALQNMIGLVCDPVANRVEVPCLGKNIMAALNALASANMALAGFNPVIPAGEVMEAMKAVGCSMPHALRCTGKGGLSTSPSSEKIAKNLKV